MRVVVFACKNITKLYYTLKLTRRAYYITSIYGFSVVGNTSYILYRLADRHRSFKVGIFRRHNASDGVFGIIQKLIYELSCVCACVFKYFFYNGRRHFFKHVNCIVDAEFFDNV